MAFPSYAYPQSHPARLATIARLCGLTPPPVDCCRVLELGCGAGGNLLPMADGLPQCQFVGVDLSPQQITQGLGNAERAGLSNVRLESRDILTLDQSFGSFDYLICHGVYSWTTDAVRDKILALCRELLSPQGVAYINYNTYPGWHLQGMLRDMLFYHAKSFASAEEQVREARRMIEFLFQTLPAPTTPFGSLVRSELEAIQRNSDPFLFHAYLNVVNQPTYLSEFQHRAAAHDLCYLGDAEPEATWPECAYPQYAAQLNQLATDPSRWCQYIDFVRFSTSRRSLLCHRGLPLDHGPKKNALSELHVSAPIRPADSSQSTATVSFVTASGRNVSAQEPRLRATLRRLADAWPASIPYSQLAQLVDSDVATVPERSLAPVETWQQEILHGFCNQVIALNVLPSRCSKWIANSPRTSTWARSQAMQVDFVANHRHETVRLNDIERRCLCLLDGSRTVDELSRQLGGQVREVLARLSANGLLIADSEHPS